MADGVACKIKGLIGSVLVDAAYTRFVTPNHEPHVMDVYLKFAPGGWIQFASAPDGWGVSVDVVSDPDGYQMGELGSVEVASGTQAQPLDRMLGYRLISAENILLPASSDPIGFRLSWSRGSVLIFNWGDDMRAMIEWADFLTAANAYTLPIE